MRNSFGHFEILLVGLLSFASVVEASGVGIYSHTESRSHSREECLRRATLVANHQHMQLQADDLGAWMTELRGNMSYHIRCDLPGLTLFVTAGPAAALRSDNTDLRGWYASAK